MATKTKGKGKGRSKPVRKKFVRIPLDTSRDDKSRRASEACKRIGWPNETYLEFGSYDGGLPFSVATGLSLRTDHGNDFGRMHEELDEWEEREVAVADAVLELGCDITVRVSPKCAIAATAMIVSKLHRGVIAYYDPAEERLIFRGLDIKEGFDN